MALEIWLNLFPVSWVFPINTLYNEPTSAFLSPTFIIYSDQVFNICSAFKLPVDDKVL